jgi:hypothetical protein
MARLLNHGCRELEVTDGCGDLIEICFDDAGFVLSTLKCSHLPLFSMDTTLSG